LAMRPLLCCPIYGKGVKNPLVFHVITVGRKSFIPAP
jgi:hypothetical protein